MTRKSAPVARRDGWTPSLGRRLEKAVKGAIPEVLRDKFRKPLYTKAIANRERGALLLLTIPKSGTNYLRLLICNYLYARYRNAESAVPYTTMHEEVFPNMREDLFSKGQSYVVPGDDHILNHTPYTDFLHTHSIRKFRYSTAKKIIYLYRNPLDNIISNFFFKWKHRRGEEDRFDQPREVIDIILDRYIRHYVFGKGLAQTRNNVLCVSYESLFGQPVDTLGKLASWLEFNVDGECIEKAVRFSDKKNVKKEEQKLGHAVHSPAGFRGSFVRSGKIGQWKEYLDDEDVAYVELRLQEHGISLSGFIIESENVGFPNEVAVAHTASSADMTHKDVA